MISILQSSAKAAGVSEADVDTAVATATAGGISPVIALIESGAADERSFTRHLADSLGWKWLESPSRKRRTQRSFAGSFLPVLPFVTRFFQSGLPALLRMRPSGSWSLPAMTRVT